MKTLLSNLKGSRQIIVIFSLCLLAIIVTGSVYHQSTDCIAYENESIETTLSNGNTTNVSITDGNITVTINGQKISDIQAPALVVSARIEDDILIIRLFSDTYICYDLLEL